MTASSPLKPEKRECPKCKWESELEEDRGRFYCRSCGEEFPASDEGAK